ncbi:hypothetical protein [Mesorhizobium sp. M0772]|uniref:hypothetical protein n=1 Tax=Mesorhizobium sp. M0772 TaxID=2956998 RepID=UPI00333DE98C
MLIDADNVSHGKIAAILAELSKYGTANIRRAYGDFKLYSRCFVGQGRRSLTPG